MTEDSGGDDGSHDDLWQATMMANSARDPFWWAMVRAEVAATPSLSEEIQRECTSCHAPMASLRPALFGGTSLRMDELADASSDRAHFGLDGVGCASCHQVDPTALGTEAGYSGQVSLLTDGRMFGPHAAPFTMPMQRMTGFVPTEKRQMNDAGLCGSCHTLRTAAVDPDGLPTGGHFLEQPESRRGRTELGAFHACDGAAPSRCFKRCFKMFQNSRRESK